MSPVIRISPTSLRLVRKRISLTAQTAGCLPLKCTHLSQFRSCCLFVGVVIVSLFFSIFSAKNIPSTLIRGYFSIRYGPVLYVSKRNSFKGCSKTRFIYYLNQNTFVMVSFSLADKSPIIDYKLQSLRRQSYANNFVQRHQLGTELEEVKI